VHTFLHTFLSCTNPCPVYMRSRVELHIPLLYTPLSGTHSSLVHCPLLYVYVPCNATHPSLHPLPVHIPHLYNFLSCLYIYIYTFPCKATLMDKKDEAGVRARVCITQITQLLGAFEKTCRAVGQVKFIFFSDFRTWLVKNIFIFI
jgi:hypothetical protein